MASIAQTILGLLTPRAPERAIATVMPRARPSSDGRTSIRRPVPLARQSCQLKIGANVVPATLHDESQDGFGVVIDRLDDLEVGKTIELYTEAGWLAVQIVNIREVGKTVDATGRREVRFQLGLRI